jgi:hypothetical protein
MSPTEICSPFRDPGLTSSSMPLPIEIEQAEPGGVSCTTRNRSFGL